MYYHSNIININRKKSMDARADQARFINELQDEMKGFISAGYNTGRSLVGQSGWVTTRSMDTNIGMSPTLPPLPRNAGSYIITVDNSGNVEWTRHVPV